MIPLNPPYVAAESARCLSTAIISASSTCVPRPVLMKAALILLMPIGVGPRQLPGIQGLKSAPKMTPMSLPRSTLPWSDPDEPMRNPTPHTGRAQVPRMALAGNGLMIRRSGWRGNAFASGISASRTGVNTSKARNRLKRITLTTDLRLFLTHHSMAYS